MEEINLQELFLILKRKLRMIILLLIISVAVAGILSYFVLEPEYETFTTLMVGKPKEFGASGGIEYNDLVLNQKLVQTYGVLIESRHVSDKVIENLALNISFKSFSNKVNVELVEDTEIIKIKATDKDPKIATNIANETASVFMKSVRKFMKVENIQIIDKAQVPNGPTKPKPMLNMTIAGILGIMIGVFIAFLQEFLDTTIKTTEDVEKNIGVLVIGNIPKRNPDEEGITVLENPKAPTTEAFRTLRTNIQFSSIDKKLKTMVVTSSTPGEGKSTIAVNLAAIIAQSKEKVLLIDCDLRKPNIHSIIGKSNLEGLTNILVGNRVVEEVAYKCEGLENLEIITSGPIPPNPAELLGSNRMKMFMAAVKEEYDMVILDTPPIGAVTDSVILSTIVDGLILVAAIAETDIEALVRGKDSLDKVDPNIIGVVLNKLPIGGKGSKQYGYYEDYGYYGEESSGRGKINKLSKRIKRNKKRG